MRYRILLSYDGSAFNGWQIQNNAPSVQEYVQHAISILLKEELVLTGAGRTDTGVNAVNFTAHFDTCIPNLDANALGYKLNAILPKEIIVHEIVEAAPDFHSRFDARSREYHYFINRRKDPFMEKFSWQCGYELDLQSMNEAASYLTGTHDFSCFEKKGGSNKTSICTIEYAEWETYKPAHVSILGYRADENDYLVFKIRADRFLRNMVRAIVGSLIEVGRGKQKPEWIKTIIAGRDRSSAGESVPGKALFFNNAEY